MRNADAPFDECENTRRANNAEAPRQKEAAGEGMGHGTTHAPEKE